MPLLVVPCAPDEADLLTVRELDALTACSRVFFERPDHPLARRLSSMGVECSPFDDEPEADWDGLGLVSDPTSPRVVALARAGASVSAGVARPVDDLTSAHAAGVVRRAAASFGDLVAVMARLRSDDGCPWDREQTHESLAVHLLEETYEVLDAIERGEVSSELREELGDVLLQVVFHARLADQAGLFDAALVADAIVAKLVHRHPHVFGSRAVSGADEVIANWESLKQEEKQRAGPFEGIPEALPALLAAYKTQKRAASIGFAPPADEARRRLDAALAHDPDDGSIGEALFWLVAVARGVGIEPEGALRRATSRFRDGDTPERGPA